MKNFEISIAGKTLTDVIIALEEATKRIEEGNIFGMDENDSGSFVFSADGEYEEEEQEEV